MSNLFDKWKESVITVYDSQELSTLELLEDITSFNDEIAKGIDDLDLKIDTEINNLNLQKTDNLGDHKGSWQGLNRPTLSDEGMRATVEKLSNEIPNLENELNQVNSHLEQINNYRDFIRYGDINLTKYESEGFKHNINFKLFRNSEGKIKHNFNIDNLISGWLTIYVKGVGGSDTNDGLTESNQLNTLQKAFEIAELRSETNIIIKITSTILTRTRSALQTLNSNQVLTKNYAIISDNETFIGSIEPQLSWSANGSCYQANRTGVAYIYDKKNRNWDNSPMRYKKVSSISECQNTKGSFYTDGSIIYIRRIDDLAIDEDILVVLLSGVFRFQLGGDIKFISKNINFVGCDNGNSNFRIMNPSNIGHVIMDNCRFLGSAYDNAYTFLNIKYSWLFNCNAQGAFRDGFNYHNTTKNKGVESFVFEYNCTSYDNGLEDLNGNNNATTGHDGINILRINTVGFNTSGPILADVNGCYSVNYDCVMYDSVRPVEGNTKSAFWFDDESPVRHGKSWLINCSGGGKDTYSLNSDGINEIYVKNFVGNNVANNQLIKFYE